MLAFGQRQSLASGSPVTSKLNTPPLSLGAPFASSGRVTNGIYNAPPLHLQSLCVATRHPLAAHRLLSAQEHGQVQTSNHHSRRHGHLISARFPNLDDDRARQKDCPVPAGAPAWLSRRPQTPAARSKPRQFHHSSRGYDWVYSLFPDQLRDFAWDDSPARARGFWLVSYVTLRNSQNHQSRG